MYGPTLMVYVTMVNILINLWEMRQQNYALYIHDIVLIL